jgi:hypothetical protein
LVYLKLLGERVGRKRWWGIAKMAWWREVGELWVGGMRDCRGVNVGHVTYVS